MSAATQLYAILTISLMGQVAFSLTKKKIPKKVLIAEWVFLAIQIAVIFFLKLAAAPTLFLVLALLALASISSPSQSNPSRLRTFGFYGFLVVWFFCKYSPAFLGYGAHLLPRLGTTQLHLQGALSLYPMAGLSFLGFKVIHFWLDRKHGKIESARPAEVLGWLFFFPTIISGPIQRFEDWQAQQRARPPLLPNLLSHLRLGIPRLAEGLFLKFVLADSIFEFSMASLNSSQIAQMKLSWLFAYALVYTLYLYFDFAGYSACAIGIARFWGIQLPENFNYPLLARNLAEFWKRWHITLSEWLKEYLFFPLTMTMKRNPQFRKLPTLGIFLPPFLTFLIAGFWHGASIGYLVFGALHGLGLGVVAYLDQKLPSKNPTVRWWRKSAWGHTVGMTINYVYVSFTFVFFLLNNHDLYALLLRLRGAR